MWSGIIIIVLLGVMFGESVLIDKVEVEGLGVLQNKIVAGSDSLLKGYGAQPKDTEHIRSVSLGSDNK